MNPLARFLVLPSMVGLMTASLSAAPDARPNILFILADDLGWMDVGIQGSPFCETPNIDRLAREGMRFTQAYTAGSVCSPTRASIQTGRYPARVGITDWIPGQSGPKSKLVTPQDLHALPGEEVTVGEVLAKAGYQTFYTGKWHLGGADSGPSAHGYEVVVEDGTLGDIGRDWQVGKRIAESAVGFLGSRDPGRPFFMFVGFHEPHTPILEYPDHMGRFREKAGAIGGQVGEGIVEHEGRTRARQDDAAYGSEVAGLDSFVGTVVQDLDARGLRDDTIVVFFSDNGGLATKATVGPTCNSPLRSGKGWLYEGGIRVPLIVRIPGVTRPGTVCDVPVMSTDFFPTLLELAGLPRQPDRHVDGISFAPLLRGVTNLEDRSLFWHYPHYHGSTWAPGAAIRMGDWKLIEFYHYETVELYDLSRDLGEARDLAGSQPDRVKTMLAQLHAWQKSVGAKMPEPNPDPDSTAPARRRNRATNRPSESEQ